MPSEDVRLKKGSVGRAAAMYESGHKSDSKSVTFNRSVSSKSVSSKAQTLMVSDAAERKTLESRGRSVGSNQISSASGGAIKKQYTMQNGNQKVIKVKRKSSKGRRTISTEHSISESIEFSAADEHSEAHLAEVDSMSSEVRTLRTDTLELGNDINRSNEERYSQINELMESLRIAMERNEKLELQFNAQLNKLKLTLRTVSDEKGELEEEILMLLKRNGELGDLLLDLKQKLSIKDDDDGLLEELEMANEELQRDIKLLESGIVQRDEIIRRLKNKPKEKPKEVLELREQVVKITGQLAYANKVNHEAVLAANVKVDHYEDCHLIGYEEEPDTIIGNSKRPVLELFIVKTDIKCEDRDNVQFTIKQHVSVRKPDNFKFGVLLFGAKEQVFPFQLQKDPSHKYKLSMGDMPCGKYRISLTNKWVNPDHDKYSSYLIKQNNREYITFDCPKLNPVIPNTQCFEFVEDKITVRQSEGVLRIPVHRDTCEGRLTYSWKTENIYRTGFHNEVGIQGFMDQKYDSTITMYLDSEHKKEQETVFWLNLEVQQPDISCLCGRNTIKVTIINDIELTIVGLLRTGSVGTFNCRDNPKASFWVTRNTTKGYCEVPWETSFSRHVDQAELRNFCECLSAPCVDINFRLDKYYWNQQSGYVRFQDGQEKAEIDLKIPCKSDLCFAEERVELRIKEPRSKGVELDKARAVCNFLVQFENAHNDKPITPPKVPTRTSSIRSVSPETVAPRVVTPQSSTTSKDEDVVDASRAVTQISQIRKTRKSAVVKHEAQIIDSQHALISWNTETDSTGVEGYVVIYWPRNQMHKSVSVFCNANESQASISFDESFGDYEVVVLAESEEMPIIQYSRNGSFEETFIKKYIGTQYMSLTRQTQSYTRNESFSASYHDSINISVGKMQSSSMTYAEEYHSEGLEMSSSDEEVSKSVEI